MLASVVTWKEARPSILAINPHLAGILDRLDPVANLPLITATFPFGSHIMQHGEFDWPKSLSPDVLQLLTPTAQAPLLLIFEQGTCELFADLESRTVPYQLLKPGQVFAAWHVIARYMAHEPLIQNSRLWNITAGVRSLFMLPKIAEQSGHERLQRHFGFRHEKPLQYSEHWAVFKAIVNSPQSRSIWRCNVTILPAVWFSRIKDPEFSELRDYIYQSMWQTAEVWRSQVYWHLILSRLHAHQKIKTTVYHMDIARHIMALASGILPGYAPLITEEAAPISVIQDAYVNIYGLAPWSPLIMQPHSLTLHCEYPIYFSLQFPTAIEMANKSTVRTSIITDTYLVSLLIDRYVRAFREHSTDPRTVSHRISQQLQYDYFHIDNHDYSKIKSHELLLHDDIRFQHELDFPRNSAFFKGCIRISPLIFTCKI